MRPIKFRAYVPYLKEMIQPCYAEIYLDGSFNVGRTPVWTETINDKNEDIVLMQYTGFLDKNKQEVCEGDIVKCVHTEGFGFTQTYTEIGIVVYDTASFVLKCLHKGKANAKDISKRYFYLHFNRKREFEIIGNLFENPDLKP